MMTQKKILQQEFEDANAHVQVAERQGVNLDFWRGKRNAIMMIANRLQITLNLSDYYCDDPGK